MSGDSAATPEKPWEILDDTSFRCRPRPYNRGMSEPAAPLPDDLALCHEIIRKQAETIREAQRRIG